jgi:hypothetical protein
MNKFVKLSAVAVLASGFVMAGNTMAATTYLPQLTAKTMSATAGGAEVSSPALATVAEMGTGNTVTKVFVTNSKTQAGSVTNASSCGTANSAVCKYQPGPPKVTTDYFNYTVNYNDANGKARSVVGRVTINITLPAGSKL